MIFVWVYDWKISFNPDPKIRARDIVLQKKLKQLFPQSINSFNKVQV